MSQVRSAMVGNVLHQSLDPRQSIRLFIPPRLLPKVRFCAVRLGEARGTGSLQFLLVSL